MLQLCGAYVSQSHIYMLQLCSVYFSQCLVSHTDVIVIAMRIMRIHYGYVCECHILYNAGPGSLSYCCSYAC